MRHRQLFQELKAQLVKIKVNWGRAKWSQQDQTRSLLVPGQGAVWCGAYGLTTASDWKPVFFQVGGVQGRYFYRLSCDLFDV